MKPAYLCFNSDSTEHVTVLKTIMVKINEWFTINSLSLNFNKTNYVHFSTKLNTKTDININYEDLQTNNTYNTKFLGLIIDNTLSWKDQINQLVTKLSSAGYSIRTLSSVMSQESLRMIYFAYVHSIMSYAIIIWGNSTHSNLICKIQTRTLTIIMKTRNKDSCRPLLRQLNILPLYSQYILSVLIFVVKNLDMWVTGRISVSRQDNTASTYSQSIYSSIKVLVQRVCVSALLPQ